MRVTLIVFGVVLLCGSRVDASPLKVVASIKPIHSLVAYLMGERGEPSLLVNGYASPHTYQLKPSQARVLQEADLIVWVGPQIESFLPRVLEPFSAERILTLSAVDGIVRLRGRQGGLWESHDHADDVSVGAGVGAHGYDAHVWMDPRNAIVMVRAIALALSSRDPEHADYYEQQSGLLVQALDALDQSVEKTLAPVRGVPFIVLHDAFHYLEARYDLTGVGAITISPEKMPSAKRIKTLSAGMAEAGVRCLFSEPQVKSPLSQMLADESHLATGVLDPLGSAVPPGPEHYFLMMTSNAQSLAECLGR